MSNKNIKNALVLDAGCGEGRNTLFLAKNRCNVVAVDLSRPGLFKAKL